MPKLPYKCSIDALVEIAIADKKKRDEAEKIRKAGLPLEAILRDVCEVFEVDYERVTTKGRQGERVLVRKIYCFVARIKTPKSYKDIAKLIGGLDHTTSLHHINCVKGYLRVKEPKFLMFWEQYLENSKLFTPNDFE
jgi:chromosomal replication initiation ATPase DnaA